MNNVLLTQNKHWEAPYTGLYPRKILNSLLANLQLRHIQVLQGIRRGGKSSLFQLLINHLGQDINPARILYLNLDDPFFISLANNPAGLYQVVQQAEKLTQEKISYLFLDEVQAIKGWEKYVKSLYDSAVFKKIFVTGSNSSLLNSNFATLLSGRYTSSQVYPLSFQEILSIHDIQSYMELNRQLPKVLNIIDEMLEHGSFVEVHDTPTELKRQIIAGYFESILLKDCVANASIRDIKGFKELAFYLTTNLTALYSYSSLAKATGLSDISVKDYIQALEGSYLFTELKQFSYSLKEQITNRKKPYLADNSFLKLGYSFSENKGKLLENLVFAELQKQQAELWYYNKESECDFILKTQTGLIAIQVCHELNDQNLGREVNGLRKLPFEVESKYIITYNQTSEMDDIKVISFWEFFSRS